MTDADERELSLPLDFLEDGKTYTAQVYRDGPHAHWDHNPYDIVIEEVEVMGGGVMEAYLASSGGIAVRFIAQD